MREGNAVDPFVPVLMASKSYPNHALNHALNWSRRSITQTRHGTGPDWKGAMGAAAAAWRGRYAQLCAGRRTWAWLQAQEFGNDA